MQFPEYQRLALKTESVPAALSMNQIALHAILELCIATSKIADLAKRKLYYGKDFDEKALIEQATFVHNLSGYLAGSAEAEPGAINVVMTQEQMDVAQIPDELRGMSLELLNSRLLHSSIGKFTESAEQLEALKAQYEGKGLDITNFAEEVGDDNWYDATGKDELTKLAAAAGLVINDATIRVGNITKLQGNAKLKGRYNAGDFDAVAALNRDLASERATLEASVSLQKAG